MSDRKQIVAKVDIVIPTPVSILIGQGQRERRDIEELAGAPQAPK